MVIYVITDNTNGKQYVGQTIHTAEYRFAQHCKPSIRSCRRLSNAIAAHGKENFTVSVLETVENVEDLDEREIYWISKLNTITPNGYNLKGGGNGKGVVSEETKQRLSASKSGKNHPCYGKHLSQETRAKIGATNKGKRLPEESLRRMAETKRGRKLSPEHCRKLAEAHKGLLVGGKNPMARKVMCVETGEVYPSITEAAQAIGVWPENLSRHLRGLSAYCGKLHWRYCEGE